MKLRKSIGKKVKRKWIILPFNTITLVYIFQDDEHGAPNGPAEISSQYSPILKNAKCLGTYINKTYCGNLEFSEEEKILIPAQNVSRNPKQLCDQLTL